MIWLTWRQSRAQLLATVGLLVVIALYLVYLGHAIRSAYSSDIVGCVGGCDLGEAKNHFVQTYHSLIDIPSIVLIAVPVIIGVFWGAPLITRELETNTYRLVWNQSVTRRRWLAVKLAVVGLSAIAATAALSVLLTWSASRYDQVVGNRFDALSFATRNVVPLGYITFAFILGTTIGLFLRRTIPAMAVTLVVIALAQLLLPSLARPHLLPPATIEVAFNQATEANGGQLSVSNSEPLMITGYTIPGGLTLTDRTPLLNSGGSQVQASSVPDCTKNDVSSGAAWQALVRCVASKNLHFEIQAQTPDRYWPFQWTEFGVFFALGLVLCGVAFWRIRRV